MYIGRAGRLELADAHRLVQVPELRRARLRHGRGHGHRRDADRSRARTSVVTDGGGGGGSDTDAAGHYAFGVPAGTYSLTATKYGYFPTTVPGVVVADGRRHDAGLRADASRLR